MKKTLLTMMAALLLGSAVSDTTVIRAEEADTVRIVFTGDLYDHITPLTLRDENGEAKLYGGQQRHPDRGQQEPQGPAQQYPGQSGPRRPQGEPYQSHRWSVRPRM